MSNPTSNFGWQMPTATDLVTDLPADFEVFGQAVDTALMDLKGGTTGQILAKNTNTDMDFVWITNDVGDITAVTAGTGISGGGTSGAVTITNDMATTITASGDIVVGTGSGTYDNLPIGTTGQILTADTTVSPYKVKWATPAGGGKVLQVVQATTTTATTLSTATYADTTITATITPTSASSKILVMVTAQCRLAYGPGGTGARYNNGNAKIVRGATDVFLLNNGNFFTMYVDSVTEIGFRNVMAFNYLDSPATTSATTYKVQANNDTGSLIFQVNSNTSTIILMEIGA